MDPRDDEQKTIKCDKPRITVRDTDEDGGDTHEPPIGGGGEPPYIEPPEKVGLGDPINPVTLKEDARETASFTTPYYRYNFIRAAGSKPYFNLALVKVVKEKGDAMGGFSVTDYCVPEDVISRLELWIEKPTGDPQIIIEGKDKGFILTEKKFDIQKSNPEKQCRKKRYRFPIQDARIVKWQIVDENGNVLNDPTLGNGMFTEKMDDSYYFYIYFAHEEEPHEEDQEENHE